jgi:hypothetical protein
MFPLFPITWQGWAVVAGSQAVIVLIYLFVSWFFADPDKGAAWASALGFLVEVVYVVIVIWKAGSRRRRSWAEELRSRRAGDR